MTFLRTVKLDKFHSPRVFCSIENARRYSVRSIVEEIRQEAPTENGHREGIAEQEPWRSRDHCEPFEQLKEAINN